MVAAEGRGIIPLYALVASKMKLLGFICLHAAAGTGAALHKATSITSPPVRVPYASSRAKQEPWAHGPVGKAASWQI